MSLASRLVAPADGEDKLPVHQFVGALGEYERGVSGITHAWIVSSFGLLSSEEADLQTILDGINAGQLDRDLLHDVLMMGETDTYTFAQVESRLGIV